MSVILTNMDIPNTCEDCNLESYCDLWIDARSLSSEAGDPWHRATIRHPNCPLREIPNGRMIDADALYESCALDSKFEVMATTTRVNEYMQLKIDAAPTVLQEEQNEPANDM